MVLPKLYSSLAQLVEHAAVNRRVVGSSPTGGATAEQSLSLFCFFVEYCLALCLCSFVNIHACLILQLSAAVLYYSFFYNLFKSALSSFYLFVSFCSIGIYIIKNSILI